MDYVTLRRMGQVEMRCERWVDPLCSVTRCVPCASDTYFTYMNLARPEAREVFGHGTAEKIEQALDLVSTLR